VSFDLGAGIDTGILPSMKSEICRVCGESFASSKNRVQCHKCGDVELVSSIRDRFVARKRCPISGVVKRDLLNLLSFMENETIDF
jgi:ribosomal protein S27AE